jgi:hypothetical protein
VAAPVAASKSMVYAFSDEAAEGAGVVAGFANAAVVAAGFGVVVVFCADATVIMPRMRTNTCKQKKWDGHGVRQRRKEPAGLRSTRYVSRLH